MRLNCQSSAIEELNKLANADRHSILIEGIEGSGKTYLAKLYSDMLNISDFICVDPSVQSLRDTIDSCCNLNSPVVVCIENLDKGVVGASYTILKFLEEPSKYVYIVVTCRNMHKIPDTIISRSAVVTLGHPNSHDLNEYVMSKYNKSSVPGILSKCIHTFKDVDVAMHMNLDQLEYFKTLMNLDFTDPVSNMSWKLMHYPDNSECPITFSIRFILAMTNNRHVHKCGVECLDDIAQSRISAHAAVSKFCMDLKYTE